MSNMDGSDHSEVSSDDDQIRYQIHTDPPSTRMSDKTNVGDGDIVLKTPRKVEKTPKLDSERRRRSGQRYQESDPKWIFPKRHEEASESEREEEFHDSIRGDESDIGGNDRTESPTRRGCEPDDYRDVQVSKTNLGRRRGPHSKNREESEEAQESQRAKGRSFFSFVTHCG